MIAYLLPIKRKGTYGLCFKLIKCLLYSYLAGAVLRTTYFNVYLLRGGNPLDYRSVDPCLSLGVLKYHFLNQYTLAIVGLMAAAAFFTDYSLFYLADYRILKLAHEIGSQNVTQCSIGELALFDHFSIISRRLWLSVGQLRQSSCRLVHFRRAHGQSFPGGISKKLRARLVLVTILSEAAVWATNLLTRKWIIA